ncbi:Flagellum-specific ATP synthase [Sodalis praecaptivus]
MTVRLKRWLGALDALEQRLTPVPRVRRCGRLTRATGLVMEASGLQLPLGAACRVARTGGDDNAEVKCEVVGFNGNRLFLMPLEEVEGIVPGAEVVAAGHEADHSKQLPLGQALLGRVLDSRARPLDGLPAPTPWRARRLSPNLIIPCSVPPLPTCWIAINGMLTSAGASASGCSPAPGSVKAYCSA